MFTSLTSDVFCRSAFGRKHSENELGKKFLMAIAEGQKMLINLSIGEFVPWLSWTNRLSGFNYRIEKVVKQMDESLNELIQEHLDNGLKTSRGEEAKDETNREYFLDVLLNIYNDNIAGASIDMDGIKALIKVRTSNSLLLPLDSSGKLKETKNHTLLTDVDGQNSYK